MTDADTICATVQPSKGEEKRVNKSKIVRTLVAMWQCSVIALCYSTWTNGALNVTSEKQKC